LTFLNAVKLSNFYNFKQYAYIIMTFFSLAWPAPCGTGPPHCWGFTVTLRHTILVRTSLVEWSARRRDLYLTTRNTHKRQISMSPAGFEAAFPAS